MFFQQIHIPFIQSVDIVNIFISWIHEANSTHMGWVFRKYANDTLFSYFVAFSFVCVNSFEQIVRACRVQNAFICDSTNGQKAAQGEYEGENGLLCWFKWNMCEISHMFNLSLQISPMMIIVDGQTHWQCSSRELLFV